MGMEKAELLLHPVRMRIVLTLHQRTLTARQLAVELSDIATTTLYHHLGLLTKAGILRVVEERPVRGTLHEKTYTLVEDSAILGVEDAANITSEQMMQYFQVFVGSLLGDFARYLDQREPGPPTDTGYQTTALYLNDEEFIRFTEAFNEFLRPWATISPASERRRRLFSMIMISDPGKPENTTEDHSPS